MKPAFEESNLERALSLGLIGCFFLSGLTCMGGWWGTIAVLMACQVYVKHVFGSLSVAILLFCPLIGGVAAVVVWWRWLFRYIPFLDRLSTWPSMLRDFFWVSLGMTLIGLIPIFYDIDQFFYRRWLGSFVPAEATVTGTRIDDVERGHLKGLAPRVLYEFRVGDKEFTGYKVHWETLLPAPVEAGGGAPPISSVIWDRTRSDGARKALTDFLRQYPTGKQITAYYDPRDPRNSCLTFIPFDLSPLAHLFVPSLILTFWFIFAVAWKTTRRTTDLATTAKRK